MNLNKWAHANVGPTGELPVSARPAISVFINGGVTIDRTAFYITIASPRTEENHIGIVDGVTINFSNQTDMERFFDSFIQAFENPGHHIDLIPVKETGIEYQATSNGYKKEVTGKIKKRLNRYQLLKKQL